MDEGQGIFVINNQEVEMKQFHSPQQNTKWNAERPRPSISCSGSSADNVMENLTSIPSENMKAEKYVVKVRVLGIREMKQTSNSVWRSSSRFMFVIELTWSNEDITFICRDHEELFTYHCWLLDTFTTEAGHNGSKRTIPLLPGKKPFSRNTIALAQERRPKIEEYLKNLVVIPALQNSAQVQAFFYRRSGDPKDDDPIVWGAIKELSGGTESPFLSSENQRIVSRLKLSSDESKPLAGSYDNRSFARSDGEFEDHEPHCDFDEMNSEAVFGVNYNSDSGSCDIILGKES